MIYSGFGSDAREKFLARRSFISYSIMVSFFLLAFESFFSDLYKQHDALLPVVAALIFNTRCVA